MPDPRELLRTDHLWLRTLRRPRWLIPTVIILAATVYATIQNWKVRVVNVIPASLEAEGETNAEPTLAVDPLYADRMFASAMWLGSEGIECGSLRAGVVVSTDRGKTWKLQCVLELEGDPDDIYADYAGDHSFDFVGPGSQAVAAYLTPAWGSLARVLEGVFLPMLPNGLAVTSTMDFTDTDQPHIAGDRDPAVGDYAMSASAIESPANCTPYDGARDAVVYISGPSPPTPTCFLERPAAMEIPSVRSAWHTSGTVYTVFYRPTARDIGVSDADGIAVVTADVVVTKGTRGATGGVTYGALAESAAPGGACIGQDNLPGIRVVRCLTIPQNNNIDPTFGQERRALSQLSIAVHPKNADAVYVAWGDSTTGSRLTLHVRASFDGGVKWDATDRITVTNATNPALAVNEDGAVGFAYQQLAVRAGEDWWDTVFIKANADFTHTVEFRLEEAMAKDPVAPQVPYLGDYMDLVAIGKDFYGVFSSNNDFARSVFPYGVTYVRKAPGTPIAVGSGVTVPVSIDPYFFAIERKSLLAEVRGWLTEMILTAR